MTTFREAFPILAVESVERAKDFYADQEWGERMATFRDADGYLLQIFAKL